MFQIIAEAKPNESSSDFEQLEGAVVIIFIDYKDIDGAIQLAKYYIEDNDWSVTKIEEAYYNIKSKDVMDESYQQYYNEILEYGYSIIYNAYESE